MTLQLDLMLATDPEEHFPNIQSYGGSLLGVQKWRFLPRLTVAELISKTPEQIQSNPFHLEQWRYSVSIGSVVSDFKEGICRYVNDDGVVSEGVFVRNKLHGFGRRVNNDGSYYIGQWKEGK